MTGMLNKRRNLDTETDTQGKDKVETHRKKMVYNWSDGSTSQGTPRITSKYQRLEIARRILVALRAIRENI